MLRPDRKTPARLALGLAGVCLSACAGGLQEAPHGRAAGQWNVTLPVTHSLAGDLAYGRGGKSLPERDTVMLAQERVRTRAMRPLHKRAQTHRASELQPPAAEPAPAPAPEPVPATPAVAPVSGSSSGRTELALADYAKRESQSQAQQEFRGGHVLVIGVTTLLVVLLIVLLILLLL